MCVYIMNLCIIALHHKAYVPTYIAICYVHIRNKARKQIVTHVKNSTCVN